MAWGLDQMLADGRVVVFGHDGHLLISRVRRPPACLSTRLTNGWRASTGRPRDGLDGLVWSWCLLTLPGQKHASLPHAVGDNQSACRQEGVLATPCLDCQSKTLGDPSAQLLAVVGWRAKPQRCYRVSDRIVTGNVGMEY